MNTCAIVIPIYKTSLDNDDYFSVKKSIEKLKDYDIYWACPTHLDLSYYHENFGINKIVRFDNVFFKDVASYSRLLLSCFFYERFIKYDFILICQTDAIILKSELDYWLNKPYDYLGAPWPSGYSLTIKTNRIPLENGIKCNAFVGNGGLSLRRIRSCIKLIKEFDDVNSEWVRSGHAEDLFFAFMGTLSFDFRLPNIVTAARFSHDIDPLLLQNMINYEIPFGVHAWNKYDRPYWINHPVFTTKE